MTGLVPYRPSGQFEEFRDVFRVPAEWQSCGPVVCFGGAPEIGRPDVFALALTPTALSLCNHTGPVWSLPVGSVHKVYAKEVSGVSLPVDTPVGIRPMIPPSAFAVVIEYPMTPGFMAELELLTLVPSVAHQWVRDIYAAVQRFHNDAVEFGAIERRDHGLSGPRRDE